MDVVITTAHYLHSASRECPDVVSENPGGIVSRGVCVFFPLMHSYDRVSLDDL